MGDLLTLLRAKLRSYAFGGLVLGLLFLVASFTPSLIPRHWAFQALVTGVVTAAGYGLGTLLSHLWRRLPVREPPPGFKQAAWSVLAVAAPVASAAIVVQGAWWQGRLHRLMEMPTPPAWQPVAALVAGLTVAVGLLGTARALRRAARRVAVLLGRWVRPRLAAPLAGILVATLLVGFLDGVVARVLLAAADQAFRVSDQAVRADLAAPTSATRSGSSRSLVEWTDLGSQGRAFVAGGPSPDELRAFGHATPRPPIRVYVGLSSGRDARQRAAVVVDELERVGAFDRAVLCVMTATGTGWIDPLAASALEYLWGGDTALATMQYSYLPSWLSFLVDAGRAREAGTELFNAVYDHWAGLPADDRPLLLVFGESLGADGSETAFSGVADIRNRTDGALWIGVPRFSALRARFTERREPGSPERLPVYDGGTTVRFAARREDLRQPSQWWPQPRVVYLQHASDPIAWWSPRLILRRPDWLEEPRGRDVLPAVRWYPLVTFWQVSADMARSTRVPDGYGHRYSTLIADAWAAIAQPPGWTDADQQRLRAVIAAQDPGR